jgi:hypothetical protein
MTQDQILDMFRSKADSLPLELPVANEILQELAQLLAESRGRLSKETFETLVYIGSVLYKEGCNQYDARADVAAIMKKSVENRTRK